MIAPPPALLPGSLFARELVITLRRPRALVIRTAMPLLLAAPLVLGGAPTFWASMLLTVLVAMTGSVGTAMTLSRARASGFLLRLRAVPGTRALLVLRWVLAAACVDVLQLVPVLALVVLFGHGGAAQIAALLLAAPAVLLLANGIGCLVAAVAGQAGEVLLDTTVVLAPLLFLGGTFTGVPRTGWRSAAAAVDPFAYLHSAFIGALGGDPWAQPAAIAVAALGTAALGVALVAFTAGHLVDG